MSVKTKLKTPHSPPHESEDWGGFSCSLHVVPCAVSQHPGNQGETQFHGLVLVIAESNQVNPEV